MEAIQSLFSMLWLISLIAFIFYWRKKVNAKKSAGENYLDDENCKNVSKIKKIIGIVCIASFVIASVIPETPKTPEEQVRSAFNSYLSERKSALEKNDIISDYECLGIDSIQFISEYKAIVFFTEQWNFKNSKDLGKTFYKELRRIQTSENFRKIDGKWKRVDEEWLTNDEFIQKYSK